MEAYKDDFGIGQVSVARNAHSVAFQSALENARHLRRYYPNGRPEFPEWFDMRKRLIAKSLGEMEHACLVLAAHGVCCTWQPKQKGNTQ